MNKIKYFFLALYDQGPFKRFCRNLYKGHIFGLFSKRSHFTEKGKSKVRYNTNKGASRAAEAMGKKHDKHFSTYRCMHCGGYHIGKNRDNK